VSKCAVGRQSFKCASVGKISAPNVTLARIVRPTGTRYEVQTCISRAESSVARLLQFRYSFTVSLFGKKMKIIARSWHFRTINGVRSEEDGAEEFCILRRLRASGVNACAPLLKFSNEERGRKRRGKITRSEVFIG